MRLSQIINEASIFTRTDKYSFGHKVRPNTSKYGKLVADQLSSISGYSENPDLTWVDKIPKDQLDTTIPLGAGSEIKYFTTDSGAKIALTGTINNIQSALNHAPGQKGSTERNVGDLSEPVLSAAVVAKLIKRGANSIEDITPEDVIECLNSAISSGNSSYTVKDKNSKIADIIKFTVSVREPTKVFMQSPGFWDTYGPLLPSAVHYANSGQIDKYADYFYKNGKVDAVWIKSDGMSDQKGKKTDIEAFVYDEETKEVRPLKGLKVSLKAGSSQFGQQGAGSITSDVKSTKGVWQSTVNFFSPLGVEIAAPKKVTDKVTFWTKAYKDAAKQLKASLAGQDARDEAGIVAMIAKLIVHHATKGDESVRLVQLGSKGISTVHSFKGLVSKLVSQDIDLTASYREGVSNNGEPRPEINIYDKTSGKSLVKLGYHATGDNKKIWNSVTMEPLLKELTTMQKPVKAVKQPVPDAPLAAPLAAPQSAPVAPERTQPVTAPQPAATTPLPMQGKNVTTMQGNQFKSADEIDKREVDMAEQLAAIKKNAGI